jgi:hypothetical protein
MAKKRAKSKTKSKRKSARAESYQVSMDKVLAFIDMFDEQERDQFVKAAAEANATLTMDSHCIAFVKKHLTDNKLHPRAARAVFPQAARGARAATRDRGCGCINTG